MGSLTDVANQLVATGKGILASDESVGTLGKRLAKAGVENTENNRRDYRQLFYTAPGIGAHLSGAIMHKEALYQSSSATVPFVQYLSAQGILPGIKVDEGLQPLHDCPGESHTLGLDSLADNCVLYRRQGARFAKWRAALSIGEGRPSATAVDINARELAQYAAVCQARDLVPIVEPEVLIEGTHTVQLQADISSQVISECMAALWRQPGIHLHELLLKPQMAIPGTDASSGSPSPSDVAHHTLDVMRKCVPPAVPGIVFLSGGQSEEQATVNLNQINSAPPESRPWVCTFSFGRALQASVLKIWSADRSHTVQAQKMAVALAAVNGAASVGQYEGAHPSTTSADNLREPFRGWGAASG